MRSMSRTHKYSFIKVFTGSDLSKRRLPFMRVASHESGPVIWLTACVHGDEVGGIVVIHEIFKILRKSPLLKGSLYAFPLMNPMGFEAGSRVLSLSKEDLNRSFPGKAAGSLAQRMAHIIFTTIMDTGPSLVLDLHNDWIRSIPYTLIDPYPGSSHRQAYLNARNYSRLTGYIVINEQEEDNPLDDLSTTLSGSLIHHGIPALTLELGGSYSIDEHNVTSGVNSILHILHSFGMIAQKPSEMPYPVPMMYRDKILEYSHQPISSSSGIVRFTVQPGETIAKGQRIARIYNVFGKLQETLFAYHDSIVLGHADSAVALPGFPLISLGYVKKRKP